MTSNIIRQTELKPGFRVVLRAIDYVLPFQVSLEQHYTTHAYHPHDDHDSEGWRGCTTSFAKDRDEAERVFSDMVEQEKRWFC